MRCTLLILFTCAAMRPALAEDPPASTPQASVAAKCPVSGKPANLAVSQPTKEGPVFFCEKGCIPLFKSEPARFEAAVAGQRKALADRPRVQVKCPVCGEPPSPKFMAEREGQTVQFCSARCAQTYSADAPRYHSSLANSFTYQTKCPVMMEKINPASFIKLPGGETIYFCCKGCDEKLLADFTKYAPNLISQGIRVEFPGAASKGDGSTKSQP